MGCHFSGYSGYGRNKDEALVSLQSIITYHAGKSEIIKVSMCDGVFNDYLRYEYDGKYYTSKILYETMNDVVIASI